MNTTTSTKTVYTSSVMAPYRWTTSDHAIAVSLASKDAVRTGRLFSEIYDQTTNIVVGYGTYDGKEI